MSIHLGKAFIDQGCKWGQNPGLIWDYARETSETSSTFYVSKMIIDESSMSVLILIFPNSYD